MCPLISNLIFWWQHLPENIDPIIFSIGSFDLHYYSIMYFLSFFVSYLVMVYRLKNDGFDYSLDALNDIFIWIIFSAVIGSRLGYVLFYNLQYFLRHPLEIFLPFNFEHGFHYTGITGLSYHGGLLGVIAAVVLLCRRHKINFWRFADFIAPAIPIGYTFGRIGNFLNGELFGRLTNVPWGMYFPYAQGAQLRHPSQLYEAFFEGIVLFIILWKIRKIKAPDGFLFAVYVIGYGIFRFCIEFVREPDSHLGFILGPFTMGQILCFAMIIFGLGILAWQRIKF